MSSVFFVLFVSGSATWVLRVPTQKETVVTPPTGTRAQKKYNPAAVVNDPSLEIFPASAQDLTKKYQQYLPNPRDPAQIQHFLPFYRIALGFYR